MKNVTKNFTSWMCVIAASLAAGFAVTTAPAVSTEGSDRIADLAEDVDIMRVVLARSINKRFSTMLAEQLPEPAAIGRGGGDGGGVGRGGSGGGGGGTATGGGAGARLPGAPEAVATTYEAALAYSRAVGTSAGRTQFTSHTRGFCADGLGVIFTTEVRTPVIATRIDSEEDPLAAASDAEDEWAEAASEVSGARGAFARTGGSGVQWRVAASESPQVQFVIDPQYVDAAVDGVLWTLGRHGAKLEGLSADDEIVVCLLMTGSRGSAFARVGSGRGSGQGGGVGGVTYSPVPLATALATSGGAATAQRVVMRVPCRVIDRFGGNDPDLAALRRGSNITMYADPSAPPAALETGGR